MNKLIAINKDGKKQAVFIIKPEPKNSSIKTEFLSNRFLNKVLRIGHKPLCLITN